MHLLKGWNIGRTKVFVVSWAFWTWGGKGTEGTTKVVHHGHRWKKKIRVHGEGLRGNRGKGSTPTSGLNKEEEEVGGPIGTIRSKKGNLLSLSIQEDGGKCNEGHGFCRQ